MSLYSPLAVARAFALARSFGHGWACLTDSAPTSFVEARALYDAEQKNRSENPERWSSPFDDVGLAPAPDHVTTSGRASWTVAPDGSVVCSVWSPRPEWVRAETLAKMSGGRAPERPMGDRGVLRGQIRLTADGWHVAELSDDAKRRHLWTLAQMAEALKLEALARSLREEADARMTPAEWVHDVVVGVRMDPIIAARTANLSLPRLMGAAQTAVEVARKGGALWTHVPAIERLLTELVKAVSEDRPLSVEALRAVPVTETDWTKPVIVVTVPQSEGAADEWED